MTTRKQPAPSERPPAIRARGQLLVIAAITIGVLFTMSAAAAQLMPGGPRPPAHRAIDDELAAITGQRRARIAELEQQAPGARCHPPGARELARLLVMDGRWDDAQRFTGDYARLCGEDPIVEAWAKAPRPRPRAASR